MILRADIWRDFLKNWIDAHGDDLPKAAVEISSVVQSIYQMLNKGFVEILGLVREQRQAAGFLRSI